jgi:tetratricopeptide (TPR) repeat protein
MADIATMRGEYELAEERALKSLRIWQQLGDKRGIALVLETLSLISMDRGRDSEAADFQRQARDLYLELGFKGGLASVLHNMSQVLVGQAKLEAATELANESLALYRELGEDRGIALSLMSLGDVARRREAVDEAEDWYREALRLFGQIGHRLQIGQVLERLAVLAANVKGGPEPKISGQWKRAAHLMAAASAIRDDMGAPWTVPERRTLEPELDRIRTAMGARLEPVWKSGCATSVDEAVAFALDGEGRAPGHGRGRGHKG